MGKSKKRKRDSSGSSSESSSSERRRKKDSDKKRKKSKKEKKEKREKKDKEGRKVSVDEPICADDYFKKNPEFRVWLSESKGKKFGDLDEKETKKYFEKFVDKYNSGSLPEKMYKGIAFSELDKSSRTSHKWTFAKSECAAGSSLESDSLKDRIYADSQNQSLLAKPKPPG